MSSRQYPSALSIETNAYRVDVESHQHFSRTLVQSRQPMSRNTVYTIPEHNLCVAIRILIDDCNSMLCTNNLGTVVCILAQTVVDLSNLQSHKVSYSLYLFIGLLLVSDSVQEK